MKFLKITIRKTVSRVRIELVNRGVSGSRFVVLAAFVGEDLEGGPRVRTHTPMPQI